MFTLTYFYKDTSLIDVELQPNYVRVTMKGKTLQLALNEEISTDKSAAQRSQTSGHLVITMPKLKHILEGKCSAKANKPLKKEKKEVESKTKVKPVLSQTGNQTKETSLSAKQIERSVERLEIGDRSERVDYANIVQENNNKSRNNVNGDDGGLSSFIFTGKRKTNGFDKQAVTGDEIIEDGDDFIDDPDVPPLE